MKQCKKCLQVKPISEFYFFNKEKQQTINRCRSCHKYDTVKWQKNNYESCKRAWTKHNRKRKGRYCAYCGTFFKKSTAQKGCTLKCRFELSIKREKNGCWEWLKGRGGRQGQRYGHISINGKHRIASHISYELHKGEIPKGKMICHTCDNPGCVNPEHLFLGTHQDNMDDMNRKGRGNAGRLHIRKYSREKICEIISLRSQGKLFREISEISGVKESACKYICKHPERANIE